MDPNLKQRIIDEAYVLFLTKGMKQTSFCDVAAAVHKSKGAVMHYFSSKRHLIDTVVKMRFFPASQLSPEMDYLEGRRWDEFLRSYKNPIERVIDSFPEKLEGNGLMYYMQFVSSANENTWTNFRKCITNFLPGNRIFFSMRLLSFTSSLWTTYRCSAGNCSKIP